MRVEVFSFMSMYAVFTSSLRPFSYLWKWWMESSILCDLSWVCYRRRMNHQLVSSY
jgi:hypothetical protein